MNAPLSSDTIGFRLALKEKVCSRTDFPNNRQNVHTPWELAQEMLEQLEKATPFQDRTFLVLNLEFVEVLCYSFGVAREKVWFVTDCQQKANVLKHERYVGVNVVVTNYLSWKPNMKFDVIVGNPPYQELNENGKNWGGGKKLWEEFVFKSCELIQESGYLCLIHPTTWRAFSDKAILKHVDHKYNPIYINLETAKKYFSGVGSRFDWYVLQKSKYGGITSI
jgi:hypothetical protein